MSEGEMSSGAPVSAEASAPVSAPVSSAVLESAPSTYSAPVAADTGTAASSQQPLPNAEKWYLAEGVEGSGPAPEFYKAGTFKTIMDQAENYTKLQSHHDKVLGGFTGAPEGDYVYDIPEHLYEAGVDVDTSEPFLKDFADYARDSNMSQDTFSGLMDQYLTYQQHSQEKSAESIVQAVNQNVEVQLAEYGEHNQHQFREALNRAGTVPGMTEDGLNDLADGITTAQGLRDFVTLVNASNYTPVPGQQPTASYNNHANLMQRLAECQKLGGPARHAAQKALQAEYAQMFPGDRVFS